MPFGLRNASQTFQRFMDQVLRGLHFAYAYIADVLIASSSEEHLQHLKQIFDRFKEYGVIVNPSKYQLGGPSLQFLGPTVNKDGISPLESRVSAWSEECLTAFDHAKTDLANTTSLFHPKPGAVVSIMSDASDEFGHLRNLSLLVLCGPRCIEILSVGLKHVWLVSCQKFTDTLSAFRVPDVRFDNIHIDIVGPLPSPNNYSYMLTCIDRFTRWPEAIPMVDITAATVAQALVSGWVSLFGVPSIITTDRRSQFESSLWFNLMKLLGTTRIHTTSYHPQASGLIEWFHRHLKGALRAQSLSHSWSEALPLMLLGIRTAIKEDLQFSNAELVNGTTLRVPGELLSSCPYS
uniref:Integrase catalytic domain-containing protein n=1 Tax=Amphimedon queenslandica TaxID=400682 RepID=A0A1X7VA49_AMPQE